MNALVSFDIYEPSSPVSIQLVPHPLLGKIMTERLCFPTFLKVSLPIPSLCILEATLANISGSAPNWPHYR